MMSGLGAYAVPVLAAYGVTIALLGGLVAASLARAARVRRALGEAEAARAAGRGSDAA
ncbi:heme exporter protein CcmD [Amaricoccus sp.]|uniref:heme exporter protein CcmD n=1 Tax=Amaricoccus sp. TaxID=1872485 RepID=UPI001B40A2EF|nr:heme exporter protein CcmD [Amaricoccus sp.]MBP7242620.1 heme exporter protein CcmD [Amaricoccus sp.]